MDCDACNNLLLDYLYEELDGAGVSTMREHLRGCDACAEALERLSLGRRAARSLPVLEAPAPGAALLAAIQAATSAPKLRLVTGSSAAVDATEPPRGRFPRWMQRVGEVAMRRQVAMAAVFLLMIGFGLSYNQFQAPTRPLPSSDDPGPTVIPAREVPAPPSPAAAARGVEPRRQLARGGSGERSVEHRAVPPAHVAAPTPPEAPAAAPAIALRSGAQSPDESPPPSAEGDDTAHGPPTSYRAQPPAPDPSVGPAVASERVSGNRDLERGLPQFPVAPPSDGVRQNAVQRGNAVPQGSGVQQAVGAEQRGGVDSQFRTQSSAQYGSNTWQGLQQQGEAHQAQGRRDAAIDAWRRALASAPPGAERTAIARRLHDALVAAGHGSEASEVYGTYLMRTSEANQLANEVPSTPANSVARPSPSRAMPQSRAPARRSRQAPASSDSYSNMGF